MKRSIVLMAPLLVWSVAVHAQETRTEVTKPTTAYDDSKPNSDEVPDVFALSGRFERVLVVRLKYQADLLEGIEKIVAKENIRNAAILAGAGSVTGYHLHVVSNRKFPSKNIYFKDPNAPADIVGMSGYVIDGRVHAHTTLANDDRAFGGHLERGTHVFTFAVITMGVLSEGLDFSRLDDKTYR